VTVSEAGCCADTAPAATRCGWQSRRSRCDFGACDGQSIVVADRVQQGVTGRTQSINRAALKLMRLGLEFS
jgi:hypothetical protein